VRFWLILICALAVAALIAAPLPRSPAAIQADTDEPQELEAFQGYLDPAPRGMDIRYAWTQAGGHGENVRIADIEFNWNLDHNDLRTAVSSAFVTIKGIDPVPEANVDHGTAVLGILVATPDGIGVTGIAHRAAIGVINPQPSGAQPRLADAIAQAAARLDRGDVMLIEQSSLAGPRLDLSTGRGVVPVEYETDIFNAIRAATSRGVIVIEPAGNGFENLDHPAYNETFNRNKRDSGAIMVGAGLPEGGVYGPGPDRVRTEESNYGARLDVQGWGRFVVTCGYGDLRREQGRNNWYTDLFGATSAAAAMVAGAVAVIQSIAKERGLSALSPAQMRTLLVSTGTPQSGDLSQRIGPRPDLRAAIAQLSNIGQVRDPKISSVVFKEGSGKLIINGENFLPADSVIEINGVRLPKHKYPADFFQADGTTTRIMSKGDILGFLPTGVEVSIAVFTPSTGRRSEPVQFRR
jgi:subtilase family protein